MLHFRFNFGDRCLSEVFDNGSDDAKVLLMWCANSLMLNVKISKGIGDYISNDVPLSDSNPPTSYPTWVNQEATGLEVVRYAEFCVQYLRLFEQNCFYDRDGDNPDLFLLTDIERMLKRDLTVVLAIKSADLKDLRKMTKIVKQYSLEIYNTIGDCADLRDELTAIEFLLNAIKMAIIGYEIYQHEYKIKYQN